MRTADRPIRFVNQDGSTLIVYSVDAPERCPACGERRCVFLAQPEPRCLCCATPGTDRYVVAAGEGALVGVTWNDRVEPEMRGGRA